MPYHISPNGSAGGCFLAYAAFCGISPLTCTIFDPTYFGSILRNHVFHISPTRLKSSIMGNYLDFALKIAHRGNTGSHRGKRKLGCVRKVNLCIITCFCLFWSFGIKPILLVFRGLYKKSAPKSKNQLATSFVQS